MVDILRFVRQGYVRERTIIHKLDPRIKLLLFFWGSIFVYIFYDVYLSLALFLFFLTLVFLAKSSRAFIPSVAILLVPFFGISFIIFAFPFPGYARNETPIFSFNVGQWIVPVYLEGGMYVTIWTLKLAVTIFGALLFLFTSHPAKITACLLKSRLPYKYIYLFMSTIQLIPILTRRIQIILEAQRSRGLNIKVGILEKLKNFLVIIIPLATGTLDDMQTTAIALESRGFSAPVKKTYIIDPKFEAIDYVFFAFMTIMTAYFIYLILTVGLVPFMKGIEYTYVGG